MRYLLVTLILLTLNSCSHFRFTPMACDNINSDPHANINEECRAYNQEEASKSFDKYKHKDEYNTTKEPELKND